ncbi:MAG: N(G),N(G)-dimethylarginine dimethylaminohydrolase [Candidatus Aminicenantes bacterium]|nr:N(G),N(G)-dimethylarginine dimethylaminohydrolase [Candidatus Aminicenantes bacterium]
MFKNAIVRKPGKSLVNGLTSANLGKPGYDKALTQHAGYVAALKKCGVEVTVLEADERFPDSVFVEDTAVVTARCAIITNPGAAGRKGEEVAIKEVLTSFYDNIEHIQPPGTLDGGDVMMVGNHFYTGLSARTNREGAAQFTRILKKYGCTGSAVPLKKVLHLKTGLAYLENNNLMAAGEFIDLPLFKRFNKIVIDESESYSANCIWVNGVVIMPAGFETTKAAVEIAGYQVLTVDVSEFRKLDGGVSCMSLRF